MESPVELLKKIGPLNLLLVMVPVALGLAWWDAPKVWIFAASCLAIIPLAGLMGNSTEMLSDQVGPGLGGLMNATFGNAAELIIAICALREGLVRVVRASITGSILGNILLVLGASFLAGGLKHKRQTFNSTAAGISATLLLLAAIGLMIPAIYDFQLRFTAQQTHAATSIGPAVAAELQLQEQNISVDISIVLFIAYILGLIFSLRTHKHLYAGDASNETKAKVEENGHWPTWVSISVLVGATVFVAIISEGLVGAIEETSKQLGWNEEFVGVIVVAIIGNAAEHSSAIVVAMKNRMELSFQIAVGSGLQVALFVAPVLVFISYLPGFPRLDLVFTILEVTALIVSVLAINMVAHDGQSNWLEGVLLLAVYVILAIAFYHLPMHAAGPTKAATSIWSSCAILMA